MLSLITLFFLLLYHRGTRKTGNSSGNSSGKSLRSNTVLPVTCHANSRGPVGPVSTFLVGTIRVMLRVGAEADLQSKDSLPW